MDAFVRRPDAGAGLRALGAGVGVVAGAFLTGLVFTVAAISLLEAAGYTAGADLAVVLVGSSIGQFLGFYVAIWWYHARIRDVRDLLHPMRPSLRHAAWAVGGLAALFAANLVLSSLLVEFGLEGAQNAIIEQGRKQPVLFLWLLPVTLLFVAPAEELLFRGVFQGLVRQVAGVAPAILISSALFGIVHFVALGSVGSRTATVAVIIVLGLVLGAVYELSESLAVPIAVHAGWNVSVFVWEYLVATGAV